MAKPFKKSSGTTTIIKQFFCPIEEEWHNSDEFTETTGYTTSGYLGEHDGVEYHDDYQEHSIWTCDECGEIVSVGDWPESRESSDVWVCGNCKDEFYSLDEALECCE